MARGRRPAPAQAKVIQGNFRGDRHQHGAAVEIALPECPKWLPRAARKHWDELGPDLVRAGLLAVTDGDLFAAYCDTTARFELITKELKTVDAMLDTTPQGFEIQSVKWQIRNKLIEQLVKLGREFGLTPAARSAIKAPPQGQLPLDGWGEV